MSKRTVYTKITPLPKQLTRTLVVEALHDHKFVISLNANILKTESCAPPANATPQEFHTTWYEMTENIKYMPGIKGKVKYKGCFYDLPTGMQSHIYAPVGLDFKNKWHIGGNEPGEPREVRELGLDIPADGLYLREDVDMRCNAFLTSFVVKQLKKAHVYLVERLVVKAQMIEAGQYNLQVPAPISSPSQRDSVMSGFSDHRFSTAMTSPTMSTYSGSVTGAREYASDNGPASPPMYQASAGQISQSVDQKGHYGQAAPSPTKAGPGPIAPQGYYEMYAEPAKSFPAELPAEMPGNLPAMLPVATPKSPNFPPETTPKKVEDHRHVAELH